MRREWFPESHTATERDSEGNGRKGPKQAANGIVHKCPHPHPQKFQTICRYYLKGKCDRGAKCKFLHQQGPKDRSDQSDTPPPPPPQILNQKQNQTSPQEGSQPLQEQSQSRKKPQKTPRNAPPWTQKGRPPTNRSGSTMTPVTWDPIETSHRLQRRKSEETGRTTAPMEHPKPKGNKNEHHPPRLVTNAAPQGDKEPPQRTGTSGGPEL